MGELSEIAARLYKGSDISAAKIRDYADAMARELHSISFNPAGGLKIGDPALLESYMPNVMIVEEVRYKNKAEFWIELYAAPGFDDFPYYKKHNLSIILGSSGIRVIPNICRHDGKSSATETVPVDDEIKAGWNDVSLAHDCITSWLLNNGDQRIVNALLPEKQRQNSLPAPPLKLKNP